ncbi:ribulose bisphosphate carboxylase small subunit [Roseospirillum parvum]|uniref:Ribulose bisphosphate carboxylase small subunit n=1 Tax=Roseospirillum parvum TaxID=83401 RepID=A0A1G7USJ9_9PROT|nr:ribulose bisphosphate carboxylase small subunit [Roseospirillum parvum]SDG50241.1 ribulose-bisphosphate carboxylase small chain [Roseospirillum parvum]
MSIQDYPSRLSDPNSRRMGTFSYLPPMTPEQLRRQIEFIVARGWTPAIEHSEPEHANSNYWYMWKLPMFGETDVDAVLAEVDACRADNPNHHVRLIGYDNVRQTQGASMVVHQAPMD